MSVQFNLNVANSPMVKKECYFREAVLKDRLVLRAALGVTNLNVVSGIGSYNDVAIVVYGRVQNPLDRLFVSLYNNSNSSSIKELSGLKFLAYLFFCFKFNLNMQTKIYDIHMLLNNKHFIFELKNMLNNQSSFALFSRWINQFVTTYYLNYLPLVSQKFSDQLESYLLEASVNDMLVDGDVLWSQKGLSFNKFLYKFVNKLTKNGKKTKAITHFFDLLYFQKLYNLINNKSYIFGDVISTISPKFKLVSLKYRGRNRLIPKLVNSDRMIFLGISLFLQAIKNRSEKGVINKMFSEILDIYNLQGNSLKLKDANYKAGLANRALLFRRPANWRVRKLYTLPKDLYYLG